MTVETGKVTGRRVLRFESFDELLAECERLARLEEQGKLRMLGNWSLAQIFEHLARGKEASIDGPPFRVPWYIRFVGPWLKTRFLTRGVPAGFKLPAKELPRFAPANTVETEAALERLRLAVQRLLNESQRVPHGVLGRLTAQEWNTLHLRHSEMHLSFALPVE